MSPARSLAGRRVSFLTLAFLGTAAISSAQIVEGARPSAPRSIESTNTYGTTSLTSHTIGTYEFVGYAADTVIESNGAGGRYPSSGDPILEGAFLLPAGAVIDHYELEACNFTPASSIVSLLFVCTSGASCLNEFTVTVPKLSGCTRVSSSPGNVIVNNQASYYFVQVSFGTSDGNTNLRAARVFYKLQVSPGPAVATFADVPTTSPQFKFVEALAAAGITAGCAGGNYCPGDPVTRGQMAVFLASALGLHFPN